MESKITISSNRIYLDELDQVTADRLVQNARIYSRAKEALYNKKYNDYVYGKPDDSESVKDTVFIKQWLKKEFSLEPQEYYITSLYSHANGILSSQKELVKLRLDEYKAAVQTRKKKLAALKSKLTSMEKSKRSLIQHSKTRNDRKPSPVYIPDALARFVPKETASREDALYLYEVRLDQEIKRVRARIAQIQEKGRVSEIKLRKTPVRVTFGTRKFYRSKDTTDISREAWHKERDFRRNNMMLFSGRFDAGAKNWLVKYNPYTEVMDITLMDCQTVRLEHVTFPYRTDDLKKVLLHKKESGWSVGYWMEFREDKKDAKRRPYILMKASFVVYSEEIIPMSDGVISIDLNADNISWSELDGEGHRIRGGIELFDLRKMSSNRRTDVLGRVCAKIVAECERTGKPLVMEDISLTEKRASMAYGNKKTNFMVSAFAYNKMTELLHGRCLRKAIPIIKINPAYTSMLAKIKYMKNLQSTVHEAASYVIGRRGMGFSETLPSYFKQALPDTVSRTNLWKQYKYIFSLIKKCDSGRFYKSLDPFKNVASIKKFAAC